MNESRLPLGPEPKPAIAPPGTCKQIGCSGWGRHAPHDIGVPSEQTWRETSQPTARTHTVIIEKIMAERVHAFCEALCRDPGVARTHSIEARILATYLRSLL